tara:strand:+ start:234 stop:593 length:360 start_codon:yes stop_codon:yes gene_type:complete
MNKLLPILLVVVLSGCGGEIKPPLENCTDSELAFNYILTEYETDSLIMTNKEFNEKWYEKRSLTDFKTVNARARWKVANKDFLSLELSEKLKDSFYEKYFKKCERKRRSYPETFDAKWK